MSVVSWPSSLGHSLRDLHLFRCRVSSACGLHMIAVIACALLGVTLGVSSEKLTVLPVIVSIVGLFVAAAYVRRPILNCRQDLPVDEGTTRKRELPQRVPPERNKAHNNHHKHCPAERKQSPPF